MIDTQSRYFPAAEEGVPAFALQITELVDSYMLWIGVTNLPAHEVERAAEKGRLCKNWACAMPPRFANVPASVTTLNKSGPDDYATTAAQRLAQKFKKQIFLSMDVPPMAPRVALEAEKRIFATLKEIEGS